MNMHLQASSSQQYGHSVVQLIPHNNPLVYLFGGLLLFPLKNKTPECTNDLHCFDFSMYPETLVSRKLTPSCLFKCRKNGPASFNREMCLHHDISIQQLPLNIEWLCLEEREPDISMMYMCLTVVSYPTHTLKITCNNCHFISFGQQILIHGRKESVGTPQHLASDTLLLSTKKICSSMGDTVCKVLVHVLIGFYLIASRSPLILLR